MIEIHLEDSIQKIKTLPDNSFDAIITDPPYNLAHYSTGNIDAHWRKTINNDLAQWDQEPFHPKSISDEFVRILKPDGNMFIFTSYNQIGVYHEIFDSLFDTFQMVVWHKTNPTPNFFKKGFLNSCELIVACWNKGHVWNFKSQKEMHNIIETPICMGKERIKDNEGSTLHPTQKPLRVLRHLIEISTNEGATVLDPFMGVGSTGAACLELNRNFVGIELDPVYFQAAKNRLNS